MSDGEIPPSSRAAVFDRGVLLREVGRRMDDSVIAKVGRVSGHISPGEIGEVMLPIRGGSEAFIAYAVDPDAVIENGARVIVIDFEPPRTVRVQPY